MRKLFLLLGLIAVILGSNSTRLFADPVNSPARDWSWYFTEARDYDGNILGQHTGASNETFSFSVSSSVSNVYLYGTLYANQMLDANNIYFAGSGVGTEGLGEGYPGYLKSYNASIFQSGEFNDRLPISAGSNLSFWVLTSYRSTPGALPGQYRAYDALTYVYDLTEPLNQYGERTLIHVNAMNDAIWTVSPSSVVTPEPVSASLFLLGAGLMALRRYRHKKKMSF